MKGFTLVETLVALFALAMLATGALAVSSASPARTQFAPIRRARIP